MNGSSAGHEDRPPAVSVCLETMKKRADFLAAARARKQPMPAFLLQARDRRDDSAAIRIGFTASKKVGNAVARNRAKRRLRALARAILPRHGRPGWDYVLVARAGETVSRDFAAMLHEFERAIARVHAPCKPRKNP